MRRSVPIALAALIALALPAAASAACPQTAGFKGSLRSAEFNGGGALGKRELKVGEAVQGTTVPVGEVHYVPRGKSATFKLHGYTSRAAGGTVFIVQCDFWTNKHLYFRLLEGRVKVTGKAIGAKADGAPPGSYVATPDATILPLPGRPGYTAKRTVTDKAKTTRTTVASARGASNLFVKVSGPAAAGRKIPCQAGRAVTIFSNGRYRNG